MVIRGAQMAEFRSVGVERYANDLVAHLRRSFPLRTADYKDEQLHKMVRAGIARSSRYNIERTHDVRRFVEFMLLISPDFDENAKTPWAYAVLTDETLDAGPKLDRVEGYAAAFRVLKPGV